ncbi:MAG: hypothetical protein EXR64_05885 [Dehalococcoidia bacterium]|nr:hypothetical protein [Dehalococcoidia bacterium]
MLIEGVCATGGGFLRRACGAEPIGQCVYCGAPFCADHGEMGADYHQVCSRPHCRAKFDDVRAHRAWIDDRRHRNAAAMCAEDNCSDRMEHLCERCRLRFCSAHLKSGTVVERRADPSRQVKAAIIMCAHCTARRRLWD